MTEAALFESLSLECRVHPGGAMTYHNSDGHLHRVYGPAVEYSGGGREWYQNDQLHRLDGPAVEYTVGHRAWFIDGKELTEAEWRQEVASMENV